ncbi:MAG TPA: hypothetical protein VGI50_11040, partial [Solirubrobacteraceae bacterium]
GSVYPTLQQLEDEGLIQAVAHDGARAFELTSAGREHLEQNDGGHVPWEAECEPGDEFAEALHSLVGQLHLAAMEVARAGDARQLKRAAHLIAQTKRELYRILAEDPGDRAAH